MRGQRIGWALVLLQAAAACAGENASNQDGAASYDAQVPADPVTNPEDPADAGGAGSGSEDAGLGDAGLGGDAGNGDPSGRDASQPDAPEHDAAVVDDLDAATDPGDVVPPGDDAGGGSVVVDGSVPPTEDPLDVFCSGRGPVIQVPASGGWSETGDVCTGTIARRVFKNAVCTCDDMWFAGYLNTGSFSSGDDGTIIKSGGAVGVNGGLSAGSYIDVGGSLRIHGTAQVNDTYELSDPTLTGGWVNVAGDLEANNPMVLAGLLTVARDARFAALPTFLGVAGVGGTLTRPPGFWPALVLASAYKEEAVNLEPPCPCKPSEILDVGAIVEQGKLKNDNHNPAVNLDSAVLSNLGFARRLELPCGRFYLDSIGGIGAVTLAVTGRTALFVGGNVSTVGAFNIELGPDAELDLFIAGNLTQVGFSPLGDRNRPANVRIFVGGEGDITLVGYEPINANLYAPKSRLYSPGYIAARGSLFVRRLHAQGYVTVDYDRDILTRGDDDACLPPPPPVEPSEPDAGTPPPPPPPECTNACDESCGSTKTCVNGSCGSCTTDADCCAPLVCYDNGRCGALVL